MELNVKRGLFRTKIKDSSGRYLFTVSGSPFSKEKELIGADGERVYSISLDPKPLDHRVKYIFTEHKTGNIFYAWTDRRINGSTIKSIVSLTPLEFFIEAESFFGEIAVRRTGFKKFDITINGKNKGYISRRKIFCEDIDDKGLLSMIYVFSLYLADNEKQGRAENLV